MATFWGNWGKWCKWGKEGFGVNGVIRVNGVNGEIWVNGVSEVNWVMEQMIYWGKDVDIIENWGTLRKQGGLGHKCALVKIGAHWGTNIHL